MKKYLAEAIGTFAIVFCGTGAIVINQESGGIIGHLGIATTFGLVVMCMIYTFGSLSSAHFNPAVSIGFALYGKLGRTNTLCYIVSQTTGAITASLLLHILFPANQSLGATLPKGSNTQTFLLEIIITYLLMLVILRSSHKDERANTFAGIAIGATVLSAALFAGPICGASMNPARSIAPAIVSGNYQSIWLYIVAPILGAILATYSQKALE